MALKMNRILAAKLLTTAACAGVAFTSYLAIKHGEKIKKAVEDAKVEIAIKPQVTKLERSLMFVKRVAPVAWKPALAMAATDAAMIAAQTMTLTEVGILTGTVGYLFKNRAELEKTIETLPGGKEALDKVRKDVAAFKVGAAKKEEEKILPKAPWKSQTIEDTGNGKLLCLEQYSGRLFRSSLEAVEEAEKKFNRDRENEKSGYDWPQPMAYNEFFDYLGIERSGWGADYGWCAEDDWYPHRSIPFENILIENDERYSEDLLIIAYPAEYSPETCWMEH